jgi:hypothetical protein
MIVLAAVSHYLLALFNQAALPHEDSNYTRRYLARYGGHFARPCPMQ